MAIILSTLNLKETIKKYWVDEESNIYKNYVDAILGMIALLVLPGVSLFTVVYVSDSNWANYTFPLLSICFAGLYDTYGRYEFHSAKNIKLAIRAVVDILALFLACLFTGSDSVWLLILPTAVLLLCGLGIGIEAFMRVKTAIEISKWASWKEEDGDRAI